jgi:hypothetical protein
MMSPFHTSPLVKLIRCSAVSLLFVGMVALAFASKGGGDKKNMGVFKNAFTPIRTNSPFSLKTTPVYTGSTFSIQSTENSRVSLHAMITYQRGNTTFILPFSYKVNISELNNSGTKTNLQFLGVKINMPK